MRLLFLSWSYPPMPYPRATQVGRLAEFVGRPLEVYCLAPSGARQIRSRASSEIDILRLPRSLPIRAAEWLLPQRYGRILMELDVSLWWRSAARQIIATQPTPSDVLVTFGQPMSDHLAGLRIRRHTGVRWIAHFSDPWADNPFDPRAKDWIASEKAVLQSADLAIFTSSETIDLVYTKYSDDLRGKARVLPHAYDPTLYPVCSFRSDRLTVRYLGNLFSGRGPGPLFEALAILNTRCPNLLSRVLFEFVGDAPASFAADPRLARLPLDCVKFLPKVSYLESLSLARSSDLLLSIDAPAENSVFLPSKLIDYVGAGKPIFGITPPGTASNLISKLGGWVADPARPEEIASELARALAYVENRRGEPWGNQAVRANYEAGRVAATFMQIITQLNH